MWLASVGTAMLVISVSLGVYTIGVRWVRDYERDQADPSMLLKLRRADVRKQQWRRAQRQVNHVDGQLREIHRQIELRGASATAAEQATLAKGEEALQAAKQAAQADAQRMREHWAWALGDKAFSKEQEWRNRAQARD